MWGSFPGCRSPPPPCHPNAAVPTRPDPAARAKYCAPAVPVSENRWVSPPPPPPRRDPPRPPQIDGRPDWLHAAQNIHLRDSVSGCPHSSRRLPWPAGHRRPASPAQLPANSASWSQRLRVPITLKHFAGHRPVVEGYGLILEHLIRFVAFPGQNDDVSLACLLERAGDGGSAVRLHHVRHVQAP